MFDNEEVIKYLEIIRISKKRSIQNLVDGVVSRRTYTRYLSNELPIPLFELNTFLTKLGFTLTDFAIYVLNSKDYDNMDEEEFLKMVFYRMYDEAYSYYIRNIKTKTLKTRFAKMAIPVAIAYTKYKTEHLSKNETRAEMEKYFNLNSTLQMKLIDEETITAVFFFYNYALILKRKRLAIFSCR